MSPIYHTIDQNVKKKKKKLSFWPNDSPLIGTIRDSNTKIWKNGQITAPKRDIPIIFDLAVKWLVQEYYVVFTIGKSFFNQYW